MQNSQAKTIALRTFQPVGPTFGTTRRRKRGKANTNCRLVNGISVSALLGPREVDCQKPHHFPSPKLPTRRQLSSPAASGLAFEEWCTISLALLHWNMVSRAAQCYVLAHVPIRRIGGLFPRRYRRAVQNPRWNLTDGRLVRFEYVLPDGRRRCVLRRRSGRRGGVTLGGGWVPPGLRRTG